MIQRTALAWSLAVLGIGAADAQISTTPQQGLAEHTPRHVSIVAARIVTRPGVVIADGSIELVDGIIVDVRAGRREAPGAVVVDAHGKSVYPAFIDVHGSYGIDAAATCRAPAGGGPAGGGPRRGPFAGMGAPASAPIAASAQHWNDRVCPERDVSSALALDAERAKTLRRLGFAASVAAPGAGVLPGQSALLSLREQPSPQQNLLAPRVAQYASFEADFSFSGVYPGSKMGAIALIRQALLDARWQRDLANWQSKHGGQRADPNAALDALLPVLDGQQPLVFDADDELDVHARHEDVRIDGEPLDPAPGLLLTLHKPAGVTCSTKDQGRLVYDLLPPRFRLRDPVLSSVGRLDRDTSGLLLMTDDGKPEEDDADGSSAAEAAPEVIDADNAQADDGTQSDEAVIDDDTAYSVAAE